MNRRPDNLIAKVEPFAFPLFLLLVILSVLFFRDELWSQLADRERLQGWIADSGVWAPVLFIAVQTIQVVVFVIPGEVAQAAAGYLFGVWLGILYSVIGITIGAGFNYLVGRWLGVPFLERVVGEGRMSRFLGIANSNRGRLGFFLFFLIPGIPKDVLCYVAGTARIGFLTFLLISTAGRIPGIVGSAIIGDAAAEERWVLAIAVLALATILFLLGLRFRRRLESLIDRVSRRER